MPIEQFHVPLSRAMAEVPTENGQMFKEMFAQGTLSVEIYRPEKVDLQQPHTRDEVYIVVAGSGFFVNENVRAAFSPGDFLFAKAGAAHRFDDFSDDFLVWVIFYGPEGGG